MARFVKKPPTAIELMQSALRKRRIAIESVFYEALYNAAGQVFPSLKTGRRREVATLIHFFLQIPEMQKALNGVLQPAIAAEVKGIFCHKAGASGPIVDFSIPAAGNGCELCDLLILVTYGDPSGTLELGNACFLQAKVERGDLWSGTSTLRQRDLYERAPTFAFRHPQKYATPSFPDHTRGHRTMPGADTSGFCYWAFGDTAPPVSGWTLNSSAVTAPSQINDESLDRSFGAAIFDLMIGEFGIRVDRSKLAEFGWDRIVHDVVLRAMQESLSCSAGLIDVRDIPRVPHAGRQLLKEALASELALVCNPFTDLANAMGSDLLRESVHSHANSLNRLSTERVREMIAGDDGGHDEPPENQNQESTDGNGGGSFIQVHLIEKEPPTHLPQSPRKLRFNE